MAVTPADAESQDFNAGAGADVGVDTSLPFKLSAGWRLKSLSGFLEPCAFFLFAFLACCAQTFWSGRPYLALLFDSSGYLWVADGLLHCCNADLVSALVSYVAGGFGEAARHDLSQKMAPMTDICKTGPVLPVIAAAAYALCGKSATAPNWSIAAALMCAVSALVAPVLWLWGRRLSGLGTARIAGLLAATYPAFLANSGRLLSEIPAISLCVASLFAFQLVIDSLQAETSRLSRWRLIGSGLVCGLASAAIMLARPPLLPLPFILGALVPLSLYVFKAGAARENNNEAYRLQARHRRSGPKAQKLLLQISVFAVSLIVGASVLLAPWAACKLLLTGKPSLTVDRYGSYNLWAGCNLLNDGWDVLPSAYVNHPDQFKPTLAQVASEVAGQAAKYPGEFVNLLLRKPARLVSAPWNDFQVAALGLPWSAQRFWQQLLLLAALFGFLGVLKDGVARKDGKLIGFAAIAGVTIGYHLINIFFITMTRYFIVAMPLVLLLAAWTLHKLITNRVEHRLSLILSLLLFPSVSAAALLLLSTPSACGWLTANLGAPVFASSLAVVVTSALSISLLLGTREFVSAKFLRLPVSIGFAFVTMSCLLSWQEQSAAVKVLLPTAADGVVALKSAPVLLPTQQTNYYLIADFSGDGTGSVMPTSINGHEIRGKWSPLWARMPEFRENLTYLAAFAYSSGKKVEDFPQWSCLPVPSQMIEPKGNVIQVRNSSNRAVTADYGDVSLGLRTVSLEKFSWSKGFFADAPGEMRALNSISSPGASGGAAMPEDVRNVSETVAADLATYSTDAALHPRVFLLGVPQIASEVQRSAPLRFDIPAQFVGTKPDSRLRSYVVPSSDCRQAGSPLFVRLTVSGKVRTDKDRATASVCLLESIQRKGVAKEEFAPMAPQVISASSQWSEFSFDDYLPIGAQGGSDKLLSLRLLLAGKPWWEVLCYNSFKGNANIEFKDLSVSMVAEEPLNLAKATVIPLDMIH